MSPYHAWRFSNDRAEAELVIRALKEASALGNIPTRDWQADVAYFDLVGFAPNLLNWFKRACLPEPAQRASLLTVRNRLLAIPGELVRPHGAPTLRLPAGTPHRVLLKKVLDHVNRFQLPAGERAGLA